MLGHPVGPCIRDIATGPTLAPGVPQIWADELTNTAVSLRSHERPLAARRETAVSEGSWPLFVFTSDPQILPTSLVLELYLYEISQPVVSSICFKASLSAKPLIWKLFFILMQIKLIFIKKGFVFRLVLKVRVFGTRKWPVPSAVKLNK